MKKEPEKFKFGIQPYQKEILDAINKNGKGQKFVFCPARNIGRTYFMRLLKKCGLV